MPKGTINMHRIFVPHALKFSTPFGFWINIWIGIVLSSDIRPFSILFLLFGLLLNNHGISESSLYDYFSDALVTYAALKKETLRRTEENSEDSRRKLSINDYYILKRSYFWKPTMIVSSRYYISLIQPHPDITPQFQSFGNIIRHRFYFNMVITKFSISKF